MILRFLLLFLLLGGSGAMAAPAPLGRFQVVKDQFLPGPELKPRAADGRQPVVLRITAVYPHGTAGFRYDLTWSALEPGTYDLTKYLEPQAGAAPVALPPVTVEAAAVLPPGPPLLDLPPGEAGELPSTGGYRYWLPAGIALWVLAGAAFFYLIRKRRVPDSAAAGPSALTLAQRMEPLLRRSLAGPLATSEKAELERLVISYGQERLGTAGLATGAVWKALREDPATGPWLTTLENWLHRPSPVPPAPEEVREFLARVTTTTPTPVPA